MKALVLALVLLALPAHADWTASGGYASIQDIDGPDAATGEIAWRRSGWEITGGWVGAQKATGDYGYAGLAKIGEWQGHGWGWFWSAGLAARTWAPGIDDALILPVNFLIGGGVTFGPVRIQIRHMSNAHLRDPNYGQNLLLIGWTF